MANNHTPNCDSLHGRGCPGCIEEALQGALSVERIAEALERTVWDCLLLPGGDNRKTWCNVKAAALLAALLAEPTAPQEPER